MNKRIYSQLSSYPYTRFSVHKLTAYTVVWKVTPRFAEWISSPKNFLFASSLLSPDSSVLELGAGVSGIVALSLGPKVSRYTATDQSYVLKILRQNIVENLDVVLPQKKSAKKSSKKQAPADDRITATELDWEITGTSHLAPVDLVIACDCIYNEALIEPLNSTCAAICRLREDKEKPTLCLIAQQLRSPDVFETWLKSFHKLFEGWQVPDKLLNEELREGSGFVVHIGVVR
jgi:hypothetical protein